MKKSYLILAIIILLAFFTRFWRLEVPETYHFDEVYHAFTAKEMLAGNSAAWEFWNTPPAGVAYEWTHPPLAKLFMSLGMLIFGTNSFGWRFFGAIFGVGIIILTYFLVKKVLKSQFIATVASIILIFESLLFVQSRIGMNDVYFIFFMLMTVLFLFSKRYFLTGLFWGLALSSKWTASYLIFILIYFFAHEFLNLKLSERRINPRTILKALSFFVFLPLSIYLFSYFPFFFVKDESIAEHIDGNSKVVKIEQAICLPLMPDEFCDRLAVLWSIQQQIYWYHTRLKATHSYTSLWYTWPLDIRPVYYYVNTEGDKIAQIYAFGNPAIFWSGIPAVGFIIYQLFKKPNFNLGLIFISYLAFWLPWSISPRIMFLYHYLPSIPFLAIMSAFTLEKLLKLKIGKIIVAFYLIFVVSTFIYFYPHVAAWTVSNSFNNNYFWFNSWR